MLNSDRKWDGDVHRWRPHPLEDELNFLLPVDRSPRSARALDGWRHTGILLRPHARARMAVMAAVIRQVHTPTRQIGRT